MIFKKNQVCDVPTEKDIDKSARDQIAETKAKHQVIKIPPIIIKCQFCQQHYIQMFAENALPDTVKCIWCKADNPLIKAPSGQKYVRCSSCNFVWLGEKDSTEMPGPNHDCKPNVGECQPYGSHGYNPLSFKSNKIEAHSIVKYGRGILTFLIRTLATFLLIFLREHFIPNKKPYGTKCSITYQYTIADDALICALIIIETLYIFITEFGRPFAMKDLIKKLSNFIYNKADSSNHDVFIVEYYAKN